MEVKNILKSFTLIIGLVLERLLFNWDSFEKLLCLCGNSYRLLLIFIRRFFFNPQDLKI